MDEPGEVTRKLTLFRRAGVPLVWWVDPARRMVTVDRGGQPAGGFGEGDTLDGSDVLPGFHLPAAKFFDEA